MSREWRSWLAAMKVLVTSTIDAAVEMVNANPKTTIFNFYFKSLFEKRSLTTSDSIKKLIF